MRLCSASLLPSYGAAFEGSLASSGHHQCHCAVPDSHRRHVPRHGVGGALDVPAHRVAGVRHCLSGRACKTPPTRMNTGFAGDRGYPEIPVCVAMARSSWEFGAPPTPPGMRVRTGRFERLRSGETREPEAVEPRPREHIVERLRAMAPPTATVGRHAFCNSGSGAHGKQLAIDGRAVLPLLELDSPQPVPPSLVQLAPDSGRSCHPEVALPAQQRIPRHRTQGP